MNAPRMRVTVVDDHALFAESLTIALRARDIEATTVVAEASMTFAQLYRAIAKTQPHLVLLDLDLGIQGDRMRFISTLSEAGVALVVVTGSFDRLHQGEALANGARAVILKSAPFADIVETVARTRNGLPVMLRSEREGLLDVYRQAERARAELSAKFALMTRRESQVLGQLMVGKQVSEIARASFVSESTVRTQVKAILAKLQVSSQLTAVAMAHQLGWRPPSSGDEPETRTRQPVSARQRAAL